MPPNQAPNTGAAGDAAAPVPPSKSPQEVRTEAIRAYFEADTKEAKQLVVKRYAFLSEIFAAINHS